MLPIFLSLTIFRHSEYLYFAFLALLVIGLLYLTNKSRKSNRLKLLYFIRLLILLGMIVCIAIPINKKIERSEEQNRLSELVYIDLNNAETLPDAEILKDFDQTVKILIRNGEAFNEISKSDLSAFAEKFDAGRESLKGKFFSMLEVDLSDHLDNQQVKKLTLIGVRSPAEDTLKTLEKHFSQILFIPLVVENENAVLKILEFHVSPNKLTLNEPFQINIEFNLVPVNKTEISIKVDNNAPITQVVDKRTLTYDFKGFSESGTHQIVAEFAGQRISQTVLVYPNKKVFIVKGNTVIEQQSDNYLLEAAGSSNCTVELIDDIPDKLHEYNAGFVRLSKILLLSEDRRELLESWISNGGGLFVSYGEDIQLRTNQIAKFKNLLPAEPLLIREPDKDDNETVEEADSEKLVARVSILLMIDNSGSMASNIGGISRFEYMKAAAKKVVENLNSEDYIGICSFNTEASTELPLSPARNKEFIYRKIDNINPPGWATSLKNACSSAVKTFEKDNSAVKQLIILSDGEETVEPNYDFSVSRKALIDGNINTSVIGFGEYNPEMLKSLVTKGGIAYFQSREKDDQGFYVQKLPSLILDDVQLAKDRLNRMYSGEKNTEEEQPDINKAMPQVVKTGNFPTFWMYNPFVSSEIQPDKVMRFVELYNFPGSFTILGVSADEADFPLISAKTFDRGKILGFAGDFNADFVPDWFNWQDSSRFFNNLLRYLSSDSFQGIELIGSSFTEKDDSVRLNTELLIQGSDFNEAKLRIYAIDEFDQKQTDADSISFNSEINENKVAGLFNEAIIRNSGCIVLEYDSQTFEIIDIPGEFKIHDDAKVINAKYPEIDGFKITTKQEELNTEKLNESVDLQLILIILFGVSVLYLADVFLRR